MENCIERFLQAAKQSRYNLSEHHWVHAMKDRPDAISSTLDPYTDLTNYFRCIPGKKLIPQMESAGLRILSDIATNQTMLDDNCIKDILAWSEEYLAEHNQIIPELSKESLPLFMLSSALFSALDRYVISKQLDLYDSVVDIGALYGRMGQVMLGESGCRHYIATDVVFKCYCMQAEYLSLLCDRKDASYFDYLDNHEFKNFLQQEKSVYHVPGWGINDLPAASQDVVFLMWVLSEINEQSTIEHLASADRLLKKNGVIFVRDNNAFKEFDFFKYIEEEMKYNKTYELFVGPNTGVYKLYAKP